MVRKKETRTGLFQIWGLDGTLKEQFRVICAVKGITMSQQVLDLIKLHVHRNRNSLPAKLQGEECDA